MHILNIAGYKFFALSHLDVLQTTLQNRGDALGLRGTVLLSSEGININLAGEMGAVQEFKTHLNTDPRFADMEFHELISDFIPFRSLRVRIKNEIITSRMPSIHPEINQAASITPQELKQWLDENREMILLDTRNDFEVQFGTFDNAINPQINHFSEFTKVVEKLDPTKPVVMFCTGGIRCEKAALYLQQQGFDNVFQLQRGILNYFKEIGNAHYHGECFVFDHRVAVDANLNVTGTQQCKTCQGPVKDMREHLTASPMCERA